MKVEKTERSYDRFGISVEIDRIIDRRDRILRNTILVSYGDWRV